MAQKTVQHQDYLMTFLKDPKKAVAYLNESLCDEGEADYELMVHRAMRNVIQVQGFAQVSAAAKVARESPCGPKGAKTA